MDSDPGPEPPSSSGLVGTLRTLGSDLLASMHDRIELLSIELQEEKFRLIQIFIWISAAILAGVLAITFASLTVVYLFWESARLAVLGGLAGFYALACIAIVLLFRRYLARQPRPFAGSLQELNTDRACIRKES